MKLGAVLMAAGFGRRFGGNKLLVPVDGVLMVERAFHALPPVLFDRAAVVSACPEILTLGSSAGFLPVFNPDAAEGRAASVRLGLEQMRDMDGVLFAVCDQPWLRRESVEKLLTLPPARTISAPWALRAGGGTRRSFPAPCSRNCWPSPARRGAAR